MEDAPAIIKLISNDGAEFVVTKAAANMITIVKQILDEIEDTDSVIEIPLPAVDSDMLWLIVEFNVYNSEHPECAEWNNTFVGNLDFRRKLELITAANSVHSQSLYEELRTSIIKCISEMSIEELQAVK